MEQNSTKFDWAIYADATLAGLSVLIPFPFLDGITENFFRRRMAPAIANQHAKPLSPETITLLNHDKKGFWRKVGGCLLLPFTLTIGFLLQLSRKIFYFLTVKKAVDALNYYWQRAFLLNHMMEMGHLDDEAMVASADSALETVLDANSTSPLTNLALKIINSPRKIVRGVRKARRGEDDAVIEEKRAEMSLAWDGFGEHLRSLRKQYEQELRNHIDRTATPHLVSVPEQADDHQVTLD